MHIPFEYQRDFLTVFTSLLLRKFYVERLSLFIVHIQMR